MEGTLDVGNVIAQYPRSHYISQTNMYPASTMDYER